MNNPLTFRDDLPYDERIAAKDSQENYLWERIKEKTPFIIKVASEAQDRRGIDATVTGLKGMNGFPEQTVQLKMRQAGDDVLLETIRPLERYGFSGALTGRDMGTRVGLYFCIDRAQTLRVFDGDALKKVAEEMSLNFMKHHVQNKGIHTLTFKQGQAKIVTDPSSQCSHGMGKVKKLVVFIDPKVIQPIFSFKLI